MGYLPRYLNEIPRRLARGLSNIPQANLSEKNISDSWRVIGVKRTLADDFQHMSLEMDWIQLLALVVGFYFSVALIFAVAFFKLLVHGDYHFVGERLESMTDFEECLWMSVGHLVTIGYGGLLPASRSAFIISTLEHFVGIFLSSLVLGIVVTKASIPTAKIIFSDSILVTSRNGQRIVLFRLGNTRGNTLLLPEIRMSYFHPIETKEGEKVWTATSMDIVEPPVLAPCFNIKHIIGEDSPFYNKSDDEIVEMGGSFGVSVSGTDEHSLQTLFARKIYSKDDLATGMRFKDVLLGDKKKRIVDFRYFNHLMPIKREDPDFLTRKSSIKENQCGVTSKDD